MYNCVSPAPTPPEPHLSVPAVGGIERLGATRMRQYVRAWINEWDLVRLDPSYEPATEVVEVQSSYAEDPDS